MLLNPAVGRAQWFVDSNYRFGFATAVSGPTLSSTSVVNPATLSGTGVSINYSDEFGLSELRTVYLKSSHDFGKVSGGIQIGSFGYDLYREWHGAGGLAFDVSESRVGIALTADRLSVPGYGSGGVVSLRIGTLIGISESVNLGLVGSQINLTRFGSILTHSPATWISALNWNWIPSASVSAGLLAESGKNPMGSVALSWDPLDTIQLRLGHEPTTGRWAVGLKVNLSNWSVPFGGVYHSELGLSRVFGIDWRKGPNR